MMQILEVQEWPSNSELIEAVFGMHVWPKAWAAPPDGPRIIDVTYGKGTWWKWMEGPDRGGWEFTGHDYRHDGVDFRSLPEPDNSFDVVAFDPDYIAPGGRDTSTIEEFNDRYGLKGTYETPAQLQETMNAGLAECARVVAPQGLVLMKCSNYVSSGKLWLGEHLSIAAGLGCGLVVEDVFVHLGSPGPQPWWRKCGRCKGGGVDPTEPPRSDELVAMCRQCDGLGKIVPRQQHARSNSSRLIVFRKPGRRTKGENR